MKRLRYLALFFAMVPLLGAVTIDGSFVSHTRKRHAVVTTSTTMDCTAEVWPVTLTAGNVTLTLPAATAGCGEFEVIIEDSGANTLTIARPGSDKINGVAANTTPITGVNKGYILSLTDSGSPANWSAVQSTPKYIRAITFELGSPALSGAIQTTDALAVQRISNIPFPCTLSAYALSLNVADSTVKVKLWRVNGGTAIPTSANSINTAGIGVPTGTRVASTTMTDFTSTAIAPGDQLTAAISTSATTAKSVVITLTCDQTSF